MRPRYGRARRKITRSSKGVKYGEGRSAPVRHARNSPLIELKGKPTGASTYVPRVQGFPTKYLAQDGADARAPVEAPRGRHRVRAGDRARLPARLEDRRGLRGRFRAISRINRNARGRRVHSALGHAPPLLRATNERGSPTARASTARPPMSARRISRQCIADRAAWPTTRARCTTSARRNGCS